MARKVQPLTSAADPCAVSFIGRIGNDNVEASGRKILFDVPDIAFYDSDASLLQSAALFIQMHASFRQKHHFFLDFQAYKLCGFRFCAQKKRQNSGACADVEQTASLFYIFCRKIGKHYGVGSVAEAALLLYDFVILQEQIVDLFVRID